MANQFLAVQAQKFSLAGSGVTAIATSLILRSFKLPDTSTNITMADFGAVIGYLTLEPGTSKEEVVSFTGVTQNADGTATLTGLTRGIRFVSPYDSVAANKIAHAGGSVAVISNESAFYSKFAIKSNDETITGAYTFSQNVTVPTTPVATTDAVSKDYADNLAISGSPDSSTTLKGISKISVAPVSAVSPISVGDNDPRVPSQGENDALVGTSGTPSSSNKYVTNDDSSATGSGSKVVRGNGSGKIDTSWITSTPVANTITLTAGENITAGQPVVYGSGRSYRLSSSATDTAESTVSPTDWISQKITTSARAKTIKNISILTRNNSGSSQTDTFTASIRADSGGKPTGADIGVTSSVTLTTISAGAYTVATMAFATPITVSASTDYHFCIRTSSGAQFRIRRGNTGSTGANVSADTGGSWSALNGPIWHEVGEVDTVVGSAYISDGNVVSRLDYIGFAQATATSGNPVTIQTDATITGLSGLTAGLKYFASDTAGSLSSTVGTYEVPLGIAASTTSLLLDKSTQSTFVGSLVPVGSSNTVGLVVIAPPLARKAVIYGSVVATSGAATLTVFRIGATTTISYDNDDVGVVYGLTAVWDSNDTITITSTGTTNTMTVYFYK